MSSMSLLTVSISCAEDSSFIADVVVIRVDTYCLAFSCRFYIAMRLSEALMSILDDTAVFSSKLMSTSSFKLMLFRFFYSSIWKLAECTLFSSTLMCLL